MTFFEGIVYAPVLSFTTTLVDEFQALSYLKSLWCYSSLHPSGNSPLPFCYATFPWFASQFSIQLSGLLQELFYLNQVLTSHLLELHPLALLSFVQSLSDLLASGQMASSKTSFSPWFHIFSFHF